MRWTWDQDARTTDLGLRTTDRSKLARMRGPGGQDARTWWPRMRGHRTRVRGHRRRLIAAPIMILGPFRTGLGAWYVYHMHRDAALGLLHCFSLGNKKPAVAGLFYRFERYDSACCLSRALSSCLCIRSILAARMCRRASSSARSSAIIVSSMSIVSDSLATALPSRPHDSMNPASINLARMISVLVRLSSCLFTIVILFTPLCKWPPSPGGDPSILIILYVSNNRQ